MSPGIPSSAVAAALDRLVAGTSLPSDVAVLAQWAEGDPRRRAVLATFGRANVSPTDRAELQDARAAMMARIGRSVHRRPFKVQPSRGVFVQGLLAALAIIAIAVVGRLTRTSRTLSITHARYHTYATRAGQMSVVTLSDGSRITLAPHTTLGIEETFGPRSRRVTLTGEAYFDVVPGAGSPFMVESPNGGTIRVLGTRFDVRSSASDAAMHVAVMSGRVYVVPRRGKGEIVTSGMLAFVTDSVAVVAPGDVTPYAVWTSGALVFDEAPVPDVLAALSRWYGMRFQLADAAIGDTRITATLSTRSSAEAMEVLKTLLKATMTFDRIGDTTIVTLHARSLFPARSMPPSTREIHQVFPLQREVGK